MSMPVTLRSNRRSAHRDRPLPPRHTSRHAATRPGCFLHRRDQKFLSTSPPTSSTRPPLSSPSASALRRPPTLLLPFSLSTRPLARHQSLINNRGTLSGALPYRPHIRLPSPHPNRHILSQPPRAYFYICTSVKITFVFTFQVQIQFISIATLL
ncbi:hypothetical protein SISSUDRAFT_292657 [Sistotremastrum suecicum HHB10207 ss-3]|uniref:Uncharacterized protein n=1 Tax=Sistotremastrum suecicum HHB10207 ss-3 TaxID=1314776 RepID=A0A165ZIS9_9AGAM|nr:hypothetical protein SISSUDRAFT_292657 [Sistotremastrum suecicum HHB10207 ss-3]